MNKALTTNPTIEVHLVDNGSGRCSFSIDADNGRGLTARLWFVAGVDDPHGKGYRGVTCKTAQELANGYALTAGRALDVLTIGYGIGGDCILHKPVEDPCPICGGDHDRTSRDDAPECYDAWQARWAS